MNNTSEELKPTDEQIEAFHSYYDWMAGAYRYDDIEGYALKHWENTRPTVEAREALLKHFAYSIDDGAVTLVFRTKEDAQNFADCIVNLKMEQHRAALTKSEV